MPFRLGLEPSDSFLLMFSFFTCITFIVGDLNDKLASISERSRRQDGERKCPLGRMRSLASPYSKILILLMFFFIIPGASLALQLEFRQETRDSGTCMNTFYGHDGVITCLDLNGPYGTLVTASKDSTVRVWDLATFKCLGQLPGHQNYVECMQLSQNLLLTGSRDSTVRTWNLADLNHSQNSRSSSPSPSESSLYSGNINGKAAETETDEYSRSYTETIESLDKCWTGTLNGHSGSVTCLYFEDERLVRMIINCRYHILFYDLAGGTDS